MARWIKKVWVRSMPEKMAETLQSQVLGRTFYVQCSVITSYYKNTAWFALLLRSGDPDLTSMPHGGISDCDSEDVFTSWPLAYDHVSLAYKVPLDFAAASFVAEKLQQFLSQSALFHMARFEQYCGGYGLLVCKECELFRLCWEMQGLIAHWGRVWVEGFDLHVSISMWRRQL